MSASESNSNRRDFLTGRSIRDLVTGHLDTGRLDPGLTPEPSSPGALMHLTRRAMACGFSIFLDAQSEQHAVDAAIAALDLLETLEAKLSIYRSHSEISELNRAGDQGVRLSPEVLEVLCQAQRLHQMTQGAFDVTAGPLARVWGFADRAPRIPTKDELADAMSRVGLDGLQLERDGRWARLTRAKMEVNLGGIGKGYALDQCAAALRKAGVENFLLHGGLSSVLAAGSRHLGRDENVSWQVEVKHPTKGNQVLATLKLKDRAIGTSGAVRQHLVDKEGKQQGHIIDPRTGWPSSQLISASALAPEAAEADALATAFFVMGVEETIDFCATYPGYGALLVIPKDESPFFQMRLVGDTQTVVDFTN